MTLTTTRPADIKAVPDLYQGCFAALVVARIASGVPTLIGVEISASGRSVTRLEATVAVELGASIIGRGGATRIILPQDPQNFASPEC
jgi:hypothetical protein